MKLKLIPLLLIPLLFVQCKKQDNIIQENVDFAEKQLSYLIAASEEDGNLRIPSTFKNGEIEFVPVDDWVSGFFAVTLLYMYELTGK